jgi:hypothetical protein
MHDDIITPDDRPPINITSPMLELILWFFTLVWDVIVFNMILLLWVRWVSSSGTGCNLHCHNSWLQTDGVHFPFHQMSNRMT